MNRPNRQQQKRKKQSQKKARQRSNQTPQQRQKRLQNVKLSQSKKKTNQNQVQKQQRKLKDRQRKSLARSQQTSEQKYQRKEKDKQRKRSQRQKQTVQQKERRTQKSKISMRQTRSILNQVKKQQLKTVNKKEKAKRKRNKIEIEKQRIKNMQKDPQKYSCGQLSQICNYCGALFFKQERTSKNTYTICCKEGKIHFPSLRGEYPEFLIDLFANPLNKNYQNFHTFIRQYNNSFAFVSFGAKYIGDASKNEGIRKAPYCLRIDGSIYHNIANSLYTQNDIDPSYSQLYVIDTDLANSIRMNHPANKELFQIIVKKLSEYIYQFNQYAKSYRFLMQMQQQMIKNGQETKDLCLVFTVDLQKNQSRYNLPTVSEVAYVWQHPDGQPPQNYNIRCYLRNSKQNKSVQLQNLHVTNPIVDPMSYPLLWINGGKGWSPQLKYKTYQQAQIQGQQGFFQFQGQQFKKTLLKNSSKENTQKRQRITLRCFKRYQCRIITPPQRSNEQIQDFLKRVPHNFSPILFAGRLFCQYIIDSYLRVEGNQLNWVKLNQKKIKSEEYTTLLDSVKQKSFKNQNVTIGKQVILPSTFQGSPRNMHQKYIDAMAMVLREGKPDLFITFTCNSQWPQIQNNLYPGQKVEQRPDLVARVFKLYLNDFLRTIVKHQLFGKVKGYVYSIQFQKRSLPHAHCLFILEGESKFDIGTQNQEEIRTRIDSIVSAQVPNEEIDQEAYKLCLQFMMHGPCGQLNPNASCMINGNCKRNFPKQYQQFTTITQNSYPLYKRRDDDRVFKNVLTNQNVVPFNLFLLKRYRAHINVQICTSVSAIKYIFKYIYKGFDCATLNQGCHLEDDVPEDPRGFLEDGILEISSRKNFRFRGPSSKKFFLEISSIVLEIVLEEKNLTSRTENLRFYRGFLRQFSQPHSRKFLEENFLFQRISSRTTSSSRISSKFPRGKKMGFEDPRNFLEQKFQISRILEISSRKNFYFRGSSKFPRGKKLFRGDNPTLNISAQTQEKVLNYDEIKAFQDARYVSGPQACWRLYEFSLHENSHTIQRLPIHQPNKKRVFYQEGHQDEAVTRAQNKRSKLQAYFQLNKVDQFARELLYYEIPQYYIFNQSLGIWRKRKNQMEKRTIGRMYSISPLYKQKFLIRTLLLHRKGATSFEDLRNVDGQICESYEQACRRMNLIQNDDLNRQTIKQATQFKAAAQVRNIFAILRVYNNMNDPLSLWNQFKKDLIEDYIYHQVPQNEAEYLAIQDINKNISYIGGMSQLFLKIYQQNQINMFIINQYKNKQYKGKQQAQQKLKKMEDMKAKVMKNPAQREAFIKICEAMDGKSTQKLFFLDGCAGTGKTFLYNTIILYQESLGRSVLAHATTGIASDLLQGGVTMHSRFKIPTLIDQSTVLDIKRQSVKGQQLIKADLIIIDQASSMHKDALRSINQLLKTLMETQKLFGGKTMLLGGDFRQTLPVVSLGTPAKIIGISLPSYSLYYKNFIKIKLHENMRAAQQNAQFKEWLLRIGQMKQYQAALGQKYVKIPKQFLCDDIIKEIYGEQFDPQDHSLSSKVIVAGKNLEVISLNNQILDRMKGQLRCYYAWNKISESTERRYSVNQLYNQEFLNSVEGFGLPPHNLKVKIGSIVMLNRNLNIKKGLCNGTRLQVMETGKNIIKAKIITGKAAGQLAFIPRIRLNPDESKFSFSMVRTQFPLLPAFAMTINKSQGQSFQKIGIALNVPVFSHGQLYVALSRIKTKDGLRIYVGEGSSQGKILEGSDETFTINVVFKKIINSKLLQFIDSQPKTLPRMRDVEGSKKRNKMIQNEQIEKEQKEEREYQI